MAWEAVTDQGMTLREETHQGREAHDEIAGSIEGGPQGATSPKEGHCLALQVMHLPLPYPTTAPAAHFFPMFISILGRSLPQLSKNTEGSSDLIWFVDIKPQ